MDDIKHKQKLSRKEVLTKLNDILTLYYTPSHKPLKQKSIRTLLNNITIYSAYIMFDIEASKREINYLKKVCQDNGIDI